MKKLITLSIVALIALLTSGNAAAQSAFDQLKSEDGVTRVYISKAMMRMAAGKAGLEGLPIGKGSIVEDLVVYDCSTTKTAKLAAKAVSDYMAANSDVEELVAVNEKGEDTYIYGQPGDRSDVYRSIVIFTKETKEATIVILNGKINMAEMAAEEDD